MAKRRICAVNMDYAEYIGSGEDGVYVAAAKGPKGWYTSSVVDCNSASFCDSLITDDGPYPSEEEALKAGRFGAMDWCIENDVDFSDEEGA